MSSKQDLIKEMLEMQKKFSAYEQANGVDPQDYFTPEAEPRDQPQGPEHVLGLSVPDPGISPPGNNPVLRQGYTKDLQDLAPVVYF